MSEARPPLRRSSRHATIVPMIYWMERGLNETEAGLMEDFTELVQKDLFVNYHDENNMSIVIQRSAIYSIIFPGIVTPYNERLIPHWKSIAKSIQENGNKLKELQICGLEIHSDVLRILAPAMRTMHHLIELKLLNNNLGSDGLICISEFLWENTTLKELSLDKLRVDDLSAAETFSSAVSNHPTLQELSLLNGQLGRDAQILSCILDGVKRIPKVQFDQNNIGSACIAIISEFISDNPEVMDFDLNGNDFEDVDSTLLAEALIKNTNLQYLELKENKFSHEGEKELMKAVYDTTSLNSIADSNHSCSLAINDNTVFDGEMWCVNASPLECRGMKILYKVFKALYACSSDEKVADLQYLNDVPLEIMHYTLHYIINPIEIMSVRPPALGCIIECDHEKLDRVFYILKRWKMPLLFEIRHHNSKSKIAGSAKRKWNDFQYDDELDLPTRRIAMQWQRVDRKLCANIL